MAKTSVDQQKLISSFVEVAVGQTTASAKRYLKATSWNLDEAITLFFIDQHNQAVPKQQVHDKKEHEVRPPLPTTRSTLYEFQTPEKVCPNKIWDSSPDSRLSSLYRPPLDLLFDGTFADAKSISSKKNLWLLVNLQSTTEFASHTLNRDLWSKDAVSQAIQSSFTLWQAYDNTHEGQKISTFYKIDTVPPVVLVINPITGQKMRMWSGKIEAQSFVEDLTEFIDAGPQQHLTSLTSKKRIRRGDSSSSKNKRVKTETIPRSSRDTSKKRIRRGDSSSSKTKRIKTEGKALITSENETCKSVAVTSPKPEQDTSLSNNLLKFPGLTEEPKGDCERSDVCCICIRFPDAKRKQRRFLKSEPLQLLWSLCYSLMEEYEEKSFRLVYAIPGASKTLDYGATMTFEQSGLANSLISVIWE